MGNLQGVLVELQVPVQCLVRRVLHDENRGPATADALEPNDVRVLPGCDGVDGLTEFLQKH